MATLGKEQHRTKPVACLGCDKVIDAATSFNGEFTPQPGALTICAYCFYPQAWTEDMSFRPLTLDERKFVENDPEVQRLIAAMKEVRHYLK
jgi:hypothetical protein